MTRRLSAGQLAGGGFATFEVSRVATGHKNALRIEINGTLGSLRFDLEQFNDLWFYDATGIGPHCRLPPDPGHRTHPPVPGELVPAWARPGLGHHLRSRDR